eukprot:4078131-Pyramimonas_sp.AAC.1
MSNSRYSWEVDGAQDQMDAECAATSPLTLRGCCGDVWLPPGRDPHCAGVWAARWHSQSAGKKIRP